MSETEARQQVIPEAAVEAAFLKLAGTECYIHKGDLQAALEAAAPHMLAGAKREAWEEGYEAADYDAPHSGKSNNPYD